MRFVALVSGGKDSFYSILEAIRQGHELVACGHLAPSPPACNGNGNGKEVDHQEQKPEADEPEESYMYQTAASECIPTLVEECLGVPLYVRELCGRSQDTSLVYDHANASAAADGDATKGKSNDDDDDDDTPTDEVEDLHLLLRTITAAHPDVTAVTSGAILSTYQRTRIESVCSRLSLTPLSYLWRIGPQRSLLQCMLEDGIDAVLVKVASPPGLVPHKHLNKTLAQLFYSGHFDRLKERFDFHICGEGGEYETLVLDAPIFRKRLVLDEVEIIDTDDGVGVLRVTKCHAEAKGDDDEGGDSNAALDDAWRQKEPLHQRVREIDGVEDDDSSIASDGGEVPRSAINDVARTGAAEISSSSPAMRYLPHVQVLPGGLAHVSQIMASSTIPSVPNSTDHAEAEAELAVQEALDVLGTLRQVLSNLFGGATPQDVVYVHLYLSNIGHFAKINKHYSAFFGSVLPPSRSCVAVGKGALPGGRRVMLDCMIQRGSGRYMRPACDDRDDEFVKAARSNPHHALRSTLHVQSISHWAPVCVGPYSQANSIRAGIIFLAGQIGLDPPTMTLVDGGWRLQLKQSWTNAASVLDALGGSLADCLSGLVYISSDVASSDNAVWNEVSKICRQSLQANGGVSAGYVDENASDNSDKYGGYEDEGTWREMCKLEGKDNDNGNVKSSGSLPLLMVALPQMPVGAIAEVELVCATNRAASCLGGCSFLSSTNCDIGLQGRGIGGDLLWDTGYDPSCRDATVGTNLQIVSSVGLVGEGCVAIVCSAAYGMDPPGASSSRNANARRTFQSMLESALNCVEGDARIERAYVLHVRVYYTDGDPHLLNAELNAAVASRWSGALSSPAVTLVPVTSMNVAHVAGAGGVASNFNSKTPTLAMQLLAVDSVHMETELWINHGRSYD